MNLWHTTLAAEQSLTQEQMQAIISHLGKIVFIAAMLIAGMLVILTLVIARRVARTAQRRIEAELTERRPTEFSDTWAAAAARLAVEPSEDDAEDFEVEGEVDPDDESWDDEPEDEDESSW